MANSDSKKNRFKLVDLLRPEIVFAVLTLMVGLNMVFITGPFQAPDEEAHFYRAYQISEGSFRGTRFDDYAGDWLPDDLYFTCLPFRGIRQNSNIQVERQIVADLLKKPFNKERKQFIVFNNTVITFPACYFPQSFGIALARFYDFSALKMLYAGRLLNLLVWIAIVFTAIKITPVFKWVVTLIAIMPMTLFLAASLSADTMINASAILLTALVMRARFEEIRPARLKSKFVIGVLCVMLSVMKLVYTPLIGLILLIPSEHFGGKRNKGMFCLYVGVAVCLSLLLWSMELKGVYTANPLYNPSIQLSLIIGDPLGYLIVVIRTLLSKTVWEIMTFIGVLGWLDTYLPDWIYYTYMPLLIGAALFDRDGSNVTLRSWERIALTIICFTVFQIIFFVAYVYWNIPGKEIVTGVFGRYFIPFAIPALLILKNRKISFLQDKWMISSIVVTIYSMGVLGVTCIALYNRYWI